MQLLQLRYFCTVAQTLNISQAAEIYQIPQPAMSRTISNLEAELGTKLFSRTRNRLALTSTGEMFLKEIQQMLQHLDAGVNLISGNAAVEIPVKLNLLILLHRVPVAQILADFCKKYPNIILYVANTPHQTGRFDLCIAGMDASTKWGFDSHMRLLRERIDIMLSKEHPLADQQVLRVRDLEKERFLLLDEGHECYRRFLPLAQAAGFAPNISVVSNDLFCFFEYLRRNMGIALAPSVAWRNFCREECVVIPLDEPLYREVFLYWNERDAATTPAIRLLMDEIIDYFRNLAHEKEDGAAPNETGSDTFS